MEILRSSALYSCATFFNALVRFVIMSIGTRVLLLEDFGAFDTIFFIGIVFSSLIIMGCDSAIVRFAFDQRMSHHKQKRLFTTSLALIGACALLFTTLLALSTTIIDYQFLRLEGDVFIICIVLFSVGFSLTAVGGSFMRANFQGARYLVATLVSAIIRIGTLLPFLTLGSVGLSTFMLVVAVTYFVAGVIFLSFMRRPLLFFKPDFRLMRQLFSYGLPLCAVVVLAGTYPLLERLIVLSVGGNISLSVYAVSAFPAIILGVAIQVINLAWVPLALKALNDSNKNFISRSALFLQGSFIVLYLCVLVMSEPIVKLLAPIDVENSAQFFPFIGMTILVRFSNVFASFGLIVEKRTGVKLTINSVGFMFGLLASYFAGTHYGVGAIPVAFFTATFIAFIIEAVVARKMAPQLALPYQIMVLNIILVAAVAAWFT